MNACVDRHATTARFPRAQLEPDGVQQVRLPGPLFPTSTSGLYFFPRPLEGRARGAHRHLVRRADGEGRERKCRGRPRRRRGALSDLGPPLPPPRSAARGRGTRLARGLRIQVRHLRLQRLEPLHVLGETRRSLRPPPRARRTSSASSRCVRYPSPSTRQHRLSHARAPRLNRLPDVTVTSARNSRTRRPPRLSRRTHAHLPTWPPPLPRLSARESASPSPR